MKFLCEMYGNTDLTWLWSALIGIFGVIVGWVLNALSNIGRLYFYIIKWSTEFKCFKHGVYINATSYDEIEGYSFQTIIDLFNNSGKQKIMRNMRVVLMCKGKLVFECDLRNNKVIKTTVPLTTYEEISVINIPAYTAIQLDLIGYLKLDKTAIDNIKSIDSCYFSYVDENNKRRKILIDKHSFNDFKATYEKVN